MKYKHLLNEGVQFTVNILDKTYRYNYSKHLKITGEITNFLNRKIKPKFDFEGFKMTF